MPDLQLPTQSHLAMHAPRPQTQELHSHPIPQFSLTPDVITAIASALGQNNTGLARIDGGLPPTRKFFSHAITNTTSDLPISVIKELRGGFKSYIPLALCTHKACLNTSRSMDVVDSAEIGLTEKGEIRVKQKSFMTGRDHHLTTDDFTEVRENFIRGMHKYLVMGDDTVPGGVRASECADMFAEFFSIIAARPDYTQDWPSYRGYLIEAYTSWVGRRDDSFGIIFNEHLFYKYKMTNLVPSILEQLKLPLSASSSTFGKPGGGNTGPRGRGRGRGGQASSLSFRPLASSPSFRCYLCGEPHSHKEHQGNAVRLVINEQGKWIDKQLGNKIVCISFNVGAYGCKRGPNCSYSHSCSLCGDSSHGSAKCTTQ